MGLGTFLRRGYRVRKGLLDFLGVAPKLVWAL